jgi:hypothetical protein
MDSLRAELAKARAQVLEDSIELARGITLQTASADTGMPADPDTVGSRTAYLRSVVVAERDIAIATWDTVQARRNSAETARSTARLAALVDAAALRAGGLVYSFLLACLYFPAALILLSRARDVAIGSTEKERREWRSDNGLGFSFSAQWVKGLAILAPLFVSVPAAQYVTKLFE